MVKSSNKLSDSPRGSLQDIHRLPIGAPLSTAEGEQVTAIFCTP